MTELGRTPPTAKLKTAAAVTRELNATPISKRALVAYHADCIDGYTSALISYLGLTDRGFKVDLLPMYYNEASELELKKTLAGDHNRKYSNLYIVDFSISLDLLYIINITYFTEVTILDHHKTAFERYMEDGFKVQPNSFARLRRHGAEIILDNSRSGAGMCWNHFYHLRAVPMLVQYVQDYDLWQYKLGEPTKWINKYLSAQYKDIDFWSTLLYGMDEPAYLNVILEYGRELQCAHDDKVLEISGNASPVTLLGKTGLFHECPKELTSDVGHALANISGTFGLMFVWPDNAEDVGVTFSLRSNGDFDVSAMAKEFGGGGHKNAAGFTVCVEEANNILRVGVDTYA